MIVTSVDPPQRSYTWGVNNGQAATQKKALPGNSWVNNPNIDLNLLKYIKPIVCNFSIFFHCSAPVGWEGDLQVLDFPNIGSFFEIVLLVLFFLFLSFSFPCSFLLWLCSFLSISYFPVLLSSFPSFLSFQLSFSFILFLWKPWHSAWSGTIFRFTTSSLWKVLPEMSGWSFMAFGCWYYPKCTVVKRWIHDGSRGEMITPTPTLHG